MPHLDDGVYDVIVIDAREDDENALRVDLAVTSGTRKGDVVTITAHAIARDAMSLLGLPATLRVVDGEPRLTLDA